MKLDIKKVSNLEFDGVNTTDYPDFCDAFVCSCDYDNRKATDEEIDYINDNFLGDFYDEIYQSII